MKKTKYKTIVNWSISTQPIYRRVFQDDNGKPYIKINNEWRCIENTPCMDYLIED